MSNSPTIKNVCESMIQAGSSHANILYALKENFGRNHRDMSKRIKHYAAALFRDGLISKERKVMYVGESGVGQKTLDKREYMMATAKRRKDASKAKARHKRNNPKYR
ncbi:MAG: hypothetical protein JKX78_03850 [Alteromonadaceae bacterium]|nr:hypothetical protein [Alteromonadaceae bacterium]MBL4909087.1 hypothetical protein [Alteromonadaceae bacterium]MBL4909153.1 hypothetical protein [Alteromonadaceae bacterium]